MTDYLNPHRIYPDNISRRIDNPPGNDSIRGNSDQEVTKMQANQCVACGVEMPEGDQVCKACRAQAETRTVAWAAENISGRIAQLETELGILKRLLDTMEATHDD